MSAYRPKVSGKSRSAVEDETRQLIEKGMPHQLASAVAQGKMSFNEALTRMSDSDRVEQLELRHGLSRSVAKQVVLGQLDLEKVLFKQRIESYKAAYFDRSSLDMACDLGQTLILGLHGEQDLKVTISSVSNFDVQVTDQLGEKRVLKKLQIKFSYLSTDWKTAGKALKQGRLRQMEDVAPIVRPQDRYRCSDKRLFTLKEGGQSVRVTLLGGEVVQGVIDWISRYEIGLRVKGDAKITVFRHALSGLWSEIPPDS